MDIRPFVPMQDPLSENCPLRYPLPLRSPSGFLSPSFFCPSASSIPDILHFLEPRSARRAQEIHCEQEKIIIPVDVLLRTTKVFWAPLKYRNNPLRIGAFQQLAGEPKQQHIAVKSFVSIDDLI
jgi:hypothetical protein